MSVVDRIGPYIILIDSKLEPKAVAGTKVYSCNGWDYGCSNDDTRATGVEHISVTLSPDGAYPFFTVAKRDLSMAALSDKGDAS